MRIPFLNAGQDDSPIRIPLPADLETRYVVYFAPGDRPVPQPEHVKAALGAWLAPNARGPIRPDIAGFVARGGLDLVIGARELLPVSPDELLTVPGAVDAEERWRLAEATHLIVIVTPDEMVHPRVGFWTALSTARALACASGGVILDPEVPRLLPVDTHAEPLPEDARINVTDHILLLTEDQRGRVRLSSRGMGKFGLPEVEIRDIPPGLGAALMPVAHGVAQHLLRASLLVTHEHGGAQAELPVGPDIRLTLQDIPHSQTGENFPEPEPGAQGFTTLRLEYRTAKKDGPVVGVVPPRGYRGDHGAWLNSVLSDLLGSGDPVADIEAGALAEGF